MRLGVTFLNRGRQWLIVESGYPYVNLFWVKVLDDSETQFSTITCIILSQTLMCFRNLICVREVLMLISPKDHFLPSSSIRYLMSMQMLLISITILRVHKIHAQLTKQTIEGSPSPSSALTLPSHILSPPNPDQPRIRSLSKPNGKRF
ncbi:hypothetical protein VNO77_16519 [Canavalia gladiata]|uniref:Uncharacterized protein n=1 Tax=Canavalia gladiata TaxID=3824 RepID=A0AAN9QWP5_CANGL